MVGVAVVALACALSSAPPPQRELGDATAPLDVGAPAAPSAQCAHCHSQQAQEWAGSRHHASFDNALFADGYAVERHRRCVNCHAPLVEQASERAPWTHEGITCVTCHMRDGAVVRISDSAVATSHQLAAPSTAARALTDPQFCAQCHEFRAHERVDGVERMTSELMQTTFSEWRAYRDAGGAGTCQSCHMPAGAHTFRGADDAALLRSSLGVAVVDSGAAVLLWSRGVGHAFPSGDLFRHLAIVVDDAEILRIGREQPLLPGEHRRVPLPHGARALHIDYHYADDGAERRGVVPVEDLVAPLVAVDLTRPASPTTP